MGVVVSFLGNDGTPSPARWVLVGLLALAIAISTAGGLYEMAFQGDSTFLDIMCSPVLQSKGRSRTYSIMSGNVLNVRHTNLLIIHYLTIDYIGHNGKHKRAKVGLTLMGSNKRDKLVKIAASLKHAPETAR